MRSTIKLDDLVLAWAAARDNGRPLSPEALCRRCPELLGPLRARLAALDAMNWLDEPDDPLGDDRLSLPDLASVSRTMKPPRPDDTIVLDHLKGAAEPFQHTLIASGVLSVRELRDFLREHSGGRRFDTASDLARELLRQGRLSAFQLGMLSRGRGKDLVLGNYVLLDRLGAGGMGRVFKARHRRMHRLAAVKLLPEELVNSPPAIDRFRREVQAAAQLEHPNVVAAFDAGEAAADGQHYLAMEYVEGQDLATLVRRRGPLPVGQALDCVIQAARGLEYAHARGVVHRDVKPSNLLLDTEGTVKVLDLGLARLHHTDGRSGVVSDLTSTGLVMGTADYMAPEQAEDTHAADHRADVYGLGCTLWFLLTGRTLYPGVSLMAKMLAHREARLPSLLKARPDVPPCLEEVLHRMVAKNPDDRFQTMTALLAELHACADLAGPGGEPVLPELTPAPAEAERDTWSAAVAPTVRKLPIVSPPLPAPRRRPFLPVLLVAAGLGLAGLTCLGVVLFRIQTPEGTVVVELEGKPIEVKVNEDNTLTITDPNDGKTIQVKVEKDRQLMTLTKEGFQALALEFNLKTADGRRLTAKFVPRDKPIPASADPDRAAAEWVRKHAGNTGNTSLTLRWDGNEHPCGRDDQLPAGPFQLVGAHYMFQGAPTPDELAVLRGATELRGLNFLGTPVGDEHLKTLAGLPALEELELAQTAVTDAGMARLAEFPKLRRLSLSRRYVAHYFTVNSLATPPEIGPALTDDGVLALGRKKDFLSLSLQGQLITDKAMPAFRGMTQLEKLSVAATGITDAGLVHLRDAKGLTSLNLGGPGITDKAMDEVTRFEQLEGFGLWPCEVTDRGLESLAKLPKLKTLGLFGTKTTGAGLAALKKFPMLEVLYLQEIPLGAEGFKALEGLNLRELHVSFMPLKDADVGGLIRLRGLRILSLRNTDISEANLTRLVAFLPECAVADNGVAFKPSKPADPVRVAAEWALMVGGKVKVSTDGKVGFDVAAGGKLPADPFILVEINLAGAKVVHDRDFALLRDLPNLEYLNLCDLSNSDSALAHLRNLPKLKEVYLDRTPVTDAGLKWLTSFSTLTKVQIQGTKVTAEGVADFKKALQNCEVTGP